MLVEPCGGIGPSHVMRGRARGRVLVGGPTLDLEPYRTVVERHRDLEGLRQRPPTNGEVETVQIGVQPGTSSGDARPRVGDENALDDDDAHQVGAAAPAPTSHAGAHWETGGRATGRR